MDQTRFYSMEIGYHKLFSIEPQLRCLKNCSFPLYCMIIAIATIPLKIIDQSKSVEKSPYLQQIINTYKSLKSNNFDFTVKILPPNSKFIKECESEKRFETLYHEDEESFLFQKNHWFYKIFWNQKEAYLHISNHSEDDSIDFQIIRALKLISSLLALKRGGIPYHCSALSDRKGKGIIFCGPSNIGKTTIGLLLHKKWTLLNDEYNIIMPEKNDYKVYSTPFTTAQKLVYCNKTSAFLKKIFFLKRGDANSTETLPRSERFKSLFKNIYTFPTSQSFSELMIENTEKICKKIDMENLYFNLGVDMIDKIDTFI